MAEHLGLKNGTVCYVGAGEDVTGVVWMSDAVVYGSFRNEQSFPSILSLAMSLQRPVIIPNRRVFREQVRLNLAMGVAETSFSIIRVNWVTTLVGDLVDRC